jgi:hypothetical protein
MTNGAGAAYNLVSFLGVNDLRTLTPPEVKTVLLDPCLQDGPVLLKASNFNLQNANTDSMEISLDIEQKILKLAWHQLCTSVFTEICPGYSSQPHAALDHIKQSYVDSEGNMVSTPVFAYYQRMMNGMRPFAGKARFPVSVCNMLMDCIDSRLVLIFRRNYKDYALAHDLQASYQQSKFPAILSAMQMSENEVKSITENCPKFCGWSGVSSQCHGLSKPDRDHPHSLLRRWWLQVGWRLLCQGVLFG